MKTKVLFLLLFTVAFSNYNCGNRYEPTEEQKAYEPLKYDITRYNKARVVMGTVEAEPNKYFVRYALTVSTTIMDAGEGVVLTDVHFAYIIGIANSILEKNKENEQLEVVATYVADNGNNEVGQFVFNRETVAKYYDTFGKGVTQKINSNEGEIEVILPNLNPKNAQKFKSFTDKLPMYEE